MASVNGYRLFTVLMGLLTLLAAPTRQGLAQALGKRRNDRQRCSPAGIFRIVRDARSWSWYPQGRS